jgi:N-ethylmaleimide reductase
MSSFSSLFKPLKLGTLETPNRIFMAPLTRCRAEAGHIPGALMVEYYTQRATAGLIIAEATMSIEGCSAFYAEPGIYSNKQVEGWRRVTHAVHSAGGRIFLQLWHGGRACHPAFNNGTQPVSASALAISGDEVATREGSQPHVVPRALRDEEIPGVVAGFKQAAENAKAAGFDGVEAHGANGYLIDQFLRDGTNKRTGPYGGALANRARLLLEVLATLSEVWGSESVGLRISPLNSFNDISDRDPIGLVSWLGARLNECNLAYLHMVRSDLLDQKHDDVMSTARTEYHGVLIGNMGYSAQEAADAITDNKVDAVAFGTPFLANPDLPARLRAGAPLNKPDEETFYTPGPKGYTDYPPWQAE